MNKVHTDRSAMQSQTESEVLSTLTSHGGFAYKPGISEYVIHTHSVPLASTVDMHYLREGEMKSLFHGHVAGNPGDECPKRSCMYINKTGRRAHESVAANCPCLKVEGKNGEPLKPRCFLTYLRSLGRLLLTESEEKETIAPESIMFCQTSTGLFDNSYPGWMRDNIGVTGWLHVSDRLMLPALRSLYWYRTYAKILRLDDLVSSALDNQGFSLVRHAITQSIHTLNGVLIKKFMAFCPESVRYQDYAKQTAYMFRDLFTDYIAPIRYFEGRIVEPLGSTYSELKEFLNTVKKTFHTHSPEKRASWLDFEFKSKSLKRMFNEMNRLKSIIEVKSSKGLDYTESPAWIFRCSTLCQTRVLGYLPHALAEVKRKQFRLAISRPLETPPKENIKLIMKSVDDELQRSKLPRNYMLLERQNDEQARHRFQEAMSAIELPLKGSASVDNFVRQGGKIEDARLLINLAIDNQWEIPIRDLHDHEVMETFTVSALDHTSSVEYTRPLFWLSYTIILNHMIDKGFYPQQLYYPLRTRAGFYKPDPMIASIVHISEPGKERNLTKSTGILAWFLTPASKITQDALAELPEHAAGLTASSHEWRHQKRISSLSDESHFIYNIRDGMTNPKIVHAFKDWTESTDFIGKMIGWAHLKSLFSFIGFPEGYMKLIAHAILEPQPVSEVVALRNFDDKTLQADPITWSGEINEGFMMGNPMTKTILHLIHVSERNVIRRLLEQTGSIEQARSAYTGLMDPVRLDRKLTTQSERVRMSTP